MPEPDGYIFDKAATQRIVRAVKVVESVRGLRSNGSLGSGNDCLIVAKLTSQDEDDPRLYAWSEWRLTNDADEALPQGLAGTVSPRNVPALDLRPETDRVELTDQIVLLSRGMYKDGDGKPAPCFYIVTYSLLPTPRPKYSYCMVINDSGDVAFDDPLFT